MALTETTLPVRFDAETLATLGHYQGSAEVGGMVSIAHPHHDAQRACRFSYVVAFGRRSHYRLFAIPDDGSPERVVAEMPVDKPAYMHSFAMTERYLVLTEFPLVVDPLRLMLEVAPFIRNYRWVPERGLRFHVFDKDSGALVASRTGRRGVRLPSRQRLRGGLRPPHRPHHVRRRRHHRSALSVAPARRRNRQRHRPADALHPAAR